MLDGCSSLVPYIRFSSIGRIDGLLTVTRNPSLEKADKEAESCHEGEESRSGGSARQGEEYEIIVQRPSGRVHESRGGGVDMFML